MIVIAELDAGLLAFAASAIEKFGGAFIAIGFFALRVVDGGANQKSLSHDVSAFDRGGEKFFDNFIVDVRGRGGESILVEHGADLFGGVRKIAGHFNFFVAHGGNLGEGAGEVSFHHVAHGVELQADGRDAAIPVRRGRRGEVRPRFGGRQ